MLLDLINDLVDAGIVPNVTAGTVSKQAVPSIFETRGSHSSL